MSFVDTLYNSFATVQKAAGKSKRVVEDLVRFFRLRVEIEEEYMKGLEKLANFNLMLREGTIANAVNALKNNCYSKAFQAKTLIDSINADIVAELVMLLKSQAEMIRPCVSDAGKINKIKEGYLEGITQAKKKYWRSCQDCEKLTGQLDEIISQAAREKLISKLIGEKQALDRYLELYQENIEVYKRFQENLKDTMTPIMNMFELQEKDRFELVKDALRKMVVYDTSYVRNVQYDLDTLAHYMESINPASDFKILVDETLAESEYPQIDFESYSAVNGLNRTIAMVPIPLQEKWAEIPSFGTIEEMYRKELENIGEKIFNSNDLTSEDFQQFNTLIKDSIGRKAWMSVLDGKTLDTQICEKGFEQLGQLMISTLNECERNLDADTLKEIIKFSLFFHNEKFEKLSKITKFHSVWAKLEAWDLIIQKSVQCELSSRELYKIFETPEEQKNIIKNIVFCQLGNIANFMKEFNVDPMYAGEIVSKYACKYNLPAEDIDTLMATVDPKFRIAEKETVFAVQRGVPEWLKTLAAVPPKRNQKSLAELLRNN